MHNPPDFHIQTTVQPNPDVSPGTCLCSRRRAAAGQTLDRLKLEQRTPSGRRQTSCGRKAFPRGALPKVLVFLFALVIGPLTALPAAAHHLWVIQEDGRLIVARGHVPDTIEEYDPACVKEVRAFSPVGQVLPLQRQDDSGRAVFISEVPAAVATVRCDWGLRVNTTQGKRLMSRAEAEAVGLRVTQAFFSTQYLKAILAEYPALTAPVGIKLELVPQQNPLAIPVGAKLPVRLLFEGQPLAGARILDADGREVLTDKDGIAVLMVPTAPPALFYASHRVAVADNPEMDYHVFTTFLTFEAAQ